jgi:hypothetical protein
MGPSATNAIRIHHGGEAEPKRPAFRGCEKAVGRRCDFRCDSAESQSNSRRDWPAPAQLHLLAPPRQFRSPRCISFGLGGPRLSVQVVPTCLFPPKITRSGCCSVLYALPKPKCAFYSRTIFQADDCRQVREGSLACCRLGRRRTPAPTIIACERRRDVDMTGIQPVR